ncbi:unnamed protein product, partial [marine sediment metagenome]
MLQVLRVEVSLEVHKVWVAGVIIKTYESSRSTITKDSIGSQQFPLPAGVRLM